MIKVEKNLQEWLQKNQVSYTLHEHPAVYTVEEASRYYHEIKGLHCKNLFLKDSKKKQFYLISLPFDKTIPLKELRKLIGAKKLTFASEKELFDLLKLEPGAVTPFGLINLPEETSVIFVLDSTIIKSEYVCFHPNENTATLSIPQNSFKKVLEGFSHIPQMIID